MYRDTDGSLYCRVSDFGLGRLVNRDTMTLTLTNMSMGTFLYMAPEQMMDAQRVDERADIFSLGLILYEILTGDPPYRPLNINHNSLPRRFIPLIQKATANAPDGRHQTIEELVSEFDELKSGEEYTTSIPDVIENLINEIELLASYDSDSIARLANALFQQADDTEMLRKVFPGIRGELLERLVIDQQDVFRLILNEYDLQIADGGLAFAYCDTVANFYREIFWFTSDYQTEELILRRLPHLGYSHNRWHVGKVFGGIVTELRDEALIRLAKEILGADPLMTAWCEEYIDIPKAPRVIRDLLREMDSEG